MPIRFLMPALCVVLLAGASRPPTVDMTGYRPQPGLEAARRRVADVRWDGEPGRSCSPGSRSWTGRRRSGTGGAEEGRRVGDAGRDLVPEFGVTTGVRRTGHGLTRANRWDVFWDAPLNHPEEVRRSTAAFHSDRCRGQDGRGTAGGLLPRALDGGLLGGLAVHGLPGHQPAAAGGRRQDRRALGRLHLPGRAEGVLLGLAPAGPLA